MNIDCIENLRVLAAINQNSVSEQNLNLLGIKYNLSDAELQELIQYCKDNGIDIYDEEDRASISDDNDAACLNRKTEHMTEEEKENKEWASVIAKRIMQMATVEANKRANGRGWICGTYASAIRQNVEKVIRMYFTREELKYIVEHLTDSDEAECFAMKDPESPETSDILNDKLNQLIPRLHVNPIYLGSL